MGKALKKLGLMEDKVVTLVVILGADHGGDLDGDLGGDLGGDPDGDLGGDPWW